MTDPREWSAGERDEIDAAVDELLGPLHAFVEAAAAPGRNAAGPHADPALRRATGDLRAALKRFADTLRS